jgi:hypothetical protein
MDVPKNKVAWLEKFRKGEVENVYDTFDCELDCECEFSNFADFVIHSLLGSHGRLGDRFAEQNRRKYKYFSRTGRVKEQIYREESRSIEQENNEGQERLK